LCTFLFIRAKQNRHKRRTTLHRRGQARCEVEVGSDALEWRGSVG